MRVQTGMLFALASVICLSPVFALPPQSGEKTKADSQVTEPDNTKVNKRDRSKSAVTADQQKEDSADRDLASKIRRAIVKDKSLSTYAHNVKVIAHGGTVTLKGPVHSAEEKQAVMAKATEIAGASNVKDQITVKGDAAEADRSRPKE